MGIGEGDGPDGLAVLVHPDATLAVDVGLRYVPIDADDLERLLERLAADGGTLRLAGGTPRADDGDEPADRENDPAMRAAWWVLAVAHRLGIPVEQDPG